MDEYAFDQQMAAGSINPGAAQYSYETKKVFVPAALLQLPHFHRDFADFSGVGFILAHELGHAVYMSIVRNTEIFLALVCR